MIAAVVLNEPHTATVTAQIDQWVEKERVAVHTPILAHYEVANALTRYHFDGKLSWAEIEGALAVVASIAVRYDVRPNKARAIEIAAELQRRSSGDAFYLELAERLDAELWTLDGPLARNAASGDRVRLID